MILPHPKCFRRPIWRLSLRSRVLLMSVAWLGTVALCRSCHGHSATIIELDDGKIYRKPLYLMVKTMVSCRFSLKPIHWIWGQRSCSKRGLWILGLPRCYLWLSQYFSWRNLHNNCISWVVAFLFSDDKNHARKNWTKWIACFPILGGSSHLSSLVSSKWINMDWLTLLLRK